MRFQDKVALITAAGAGIGRATADTMAREGAIVIGVDTDQARLDAMVAAIAEAGGRAHAQCANALDPTQVDAVVAGTARQFGGVDILVNTAALFPSSPDGVITDAQWAKTLEVNVTANYFLADEAREIFADQGLDGSIVLTSSANAVVSKHGSEAYDVSKAALSHLIRELSISLSPTVRVNGISPATVVKGSTMFPRDRVKASLSKYKIPFEESLSDDELRNLLAGFYAKRTLTHQPIDPADCAEAILFLASPRARCTTGHLIPVDGGLTEAFLR